VPYELPSGRTARLRGKWDSVDLVNKGIWLQENKTKGSIDVGMMQRNLAFDLQTGLYLVALDNFSFDDDALIPPGSEIAVIRGVRYNVIRRPLAGGKGSIRQGKNESIEQFYARLAEIIEGATGPEFGMLPEESYFFMRWKVEVSAEDISRFKQRFLNPVLEQLCDWYVDIMDSPDPFRESLVGRHSTHFQMPYGVYSPLLDGRPTEVDEYLATGSMAGLQRAEKLFTELE
jgi:hypothetical protein